MKIKKIELFNFGSYEESNVFEVTGNNPSERIVIVGGKNGAGKTTLFTALQVGLYGHVAFGYKVAGKLYYKEIFNLINSHARMDERKKAYVKISFSEDSIDTDHYDVTRIWTWSNGKVSESLMVFKNGCPIVEDELTDFQNYLLHLIPPGLLSLYFFDGEKIADYFLDDQKNTIKDALLVLSGNDTYEILYSNIRRLLSGTEAGDDSIAQNYADQKEAHARYLVQAQTYQNQLSELMTEIEQTESDLRHENETYATRGGVSLDVWKNLQRQLAEEEDRREKLNFEMKTATAEVLPLLIVKDLLPKLKQQISAERELQTYITLQNAISKKAFQKYISRTVAQTSNQDTTDAAEVIYSAICKYFNNPKVSKIQPLFKLSEDEISAVLSQIKRTLLFNPSEFSAYRDEINTSIQKSKEIRERIQNSSIENYEEHVQRIAELNYALQNAHIQESQIQRKLQEKEQEIETVKKTLEASRRMLEAELKKQSVAALSDRVMLLVEELQDQEYKRLIAAVEADMNHKFNQMIHKSDFVDHIYLDEDFALHFVRKQPVEVAALKEVLRKHGVNALKNAIGSRACIVLMETLAANEITISAALESFEDEQIILPIELDQTRFSNGEKQILVMALYWAIMRQSHNTIPFIIDTPFARIDTEHRANITELFFKELPGQLFVLSTNEEIKKEHLTALEGQIAKVYLLEYGDDKRTRITAGNYFEV